MKLMTESHLTTARALLFSLGLLISFNIFAAPKVLQAQIDVLNAQMASITYAIGDTGPAGGIVFYLSNGDGIIGTHGLEAAPRDQVLTEESPPEGKARRERWGCFGTEVNKGEDDATAVGSGAQNTADILLACGDEPGTAAKLVDAYSLNNYTDWFLPSLDELNLMYTKIGPGAPAPITNVGGFVTSGYTGYWSSTERSADGAWGQSFGNGNQFSTPKTSLHRVRAVRAF